LISFIISIFTFILAEAYILLNGGEVLAFNAVLKVLALILLQIISSSFILFFIVSFMKTSSAFGTLSTVLGTLIGFLTGIYIPIGNLPSYVQTIIKLFPPAHTGTLLRQVMMKQAEQVTFAGAPSNFIEDFHLSMGVTFQLGETTITPVMSIVFLLITTLLFFGLAVFRLSKKER